ncbi:similar to Saccharomyces cerevisiae YGR110W CLD1 Mitochondrial cardiolipin-specific phospholipase [Maudiozyma barnettii]|uniref:Similar to Saccharomyces cerevisiae YGR110W CLD1 Mitochondrial cardiolipin-specific phospholipase n=1 Tax=Maudiozyma barnettii TaxID=61262 RepID=A0A8H2VAV8_9SACH|nr:carboxylic ester hydrolase [Kazachstania barnettii]CAB4251879.1 similar to Saccharomyces cerevisiae YGR110W CLD1 Mitochondrial cardiolipin-specific phospholipase [Kazachstania barnettii]CAD1778179.1 similar to Saccharomyces cerevisiae YGR110W CLD1 Mitochondrial cardiolipin-specific phospholipase [Kazachstania barnettii]
MPVNVSKVGFKYLVDSTMFRLGLRSQTQPRVQVNAVTSTENNTLQAPTPPTAIPLMTILRRLPSLFPRSLSESYQDFKQFNSNQEQIQQDLLSTLPAFNTLSENQVSAKLLKTPVDDQGNYINELCIEPKVPNKPLKHLIFVHGYGAGLGFFIKNLEHMPLVDNQWCIHAIDMPGFGFSSRPKFLFQYGKTSATEVNDWFHTRINRWFEKRSLLDKPQSNIVVAHSLGAYIMALYANKYPTHFKKLIMCSPAGVCHSKNIIQDKLNQRIQKHANLNPPWWYSKLWDMNFSPFAIIRNSGPFGSMITSGWSYKRFKRFPLQELSPSSLSKQQFELLHKYTYSIFNRPGSGEYLLPFVLGCGGVPRDALEETIFKNINDPELFKAKCDWVWMYGENDWMNKDGAQNISNNMNNIYGNKKSKVIIVPGAGHHLYFDNYPFFNQEVVNEMENI